MAAYMVTDNVEHETDGFVISFLFDVLSQKWNLNVYLGPYVKSAACLWSTGGPEYH